MNHLAGSNNQLEANKKLVLDFWRSVFEAEDAEAAVNFLATDYIQHNPDIPQGRQGFIDIFSNKWKHSQHGVTYQNPPVIVLAEGDLVQLVIRFPLPEPGEPTKTYDLYWFDLFKVHDGMIVEHWDAAKKS